LGLAAAGLAAFLAAAAFFSRAFLTASPNLKRLPAKNKEVKKNENQI
jgi:hypothetical protein